MLYNRPNIFFKKYSGWAPLFIRLIVGFHLIYGVTDNILSNARMTEFSEFLNDHRVIYPTVAAYLSVYAQFIAGISFIIGYYIRTSAIIMIIHFSLALIIVHIGDNYTNLFPALFMLSSSFSLFFSGAGKLSIDPYRGRNFRRLKKRKPF